MGAGVLQIFLIRKTIEIGVQCQHCVFWQPELSALFLEPGYYGSPIPTEQTNPTKLAAVICTYKREDYVKRNLQHLNQSIAATAVLVWEQTNLFCLDFLLIQCFAVILTVHSILPDLDFIKQDNLIQMESNSEKADFCGWWYCCIPLCRIDENNLPLPLFIKIDDISSL